MSDTNRFAPPIAEVALPDKTREVDVVALRLADTSLKRARLSFVVFFISLIVQIYGAKGRTEWNGVFLLLYLLSFLAAHFFLAQAARRSGRSLVLYGLASVFFPLLGGIISFGFLRHFVPEPTSEL